MFRIILKSKIHRVKVTQANLYYEGSITIDKKLMQAADIAENEKVEVFNVNNGQRLETYAICGAPNSGVICLNGPAARGSCVNDELIIVAYAFVEDSKISKVRPKIIKVDARNRIKN